MSCIDQIPIWIANYEGFQEMPLELSAEIDRLVETKGMNTHIEETREFLADRYNTLQDEIDRLRVASASGSKVLLVKEGEEPCVS